MYNDLSSSDSTSLCGSELARDSGVTVNEDIEGQAVIASKLAPTGITVQVGGIIGSA